MTNLEAQVPCASNGHPVTVTVDGVSYTFPSNHVTVREVIAATGADPSTRRLVRVNKREQFPYANLDEYANLHEHETLITVSLGPTPVS